MRNYTLLTLGLISMVSYSCSGDFRKPPLPKYLPQSGEVNHSRLFPQTFKKSYKPQKISVNYNVTIPAKISAQKLNATFQGKLKGKGADVIAIATEFGLCPLFISGVLTHESGNGVSDYAKDVNNVSGMLRYNKKKKKWLPISYKSVNECIRATCSNLKRNYVNSKRITVQTIGNKYCPVLKPGQKGFNDPKGVNKHWQGKVVVWMTLLSK